MVLDTSLFNTQKYKVRIKGKVGQSRERSNALPYASVGGDLKSTTIAGQRGSGSNGNKEALLILLTGSRTIKCSLESYPGHFWVGFLLHCRRYN